MGKHRARCKCGFASDPCETVKRAEVLGDIHETAHYTRPYQHDVHVETNMGGVWV